MKYFIGCDLGLSGAISLLDEKGNLICCEPLPTISVLVGKKIRQQYDIQGICDIIRRWVNECEVSGACMERLRAIPDQTSQTAFSMGGATMLFKALFTVYKIPFTETEPCKWQKQVFGKLGVQYNKDTTKSASIQAAKQLFPGFNFKRTEKCRTDSDGMTDSALIGYYYINN